MRTIRLTTLTCSTLLLAGCMGELGVTLSSRPVEPVELPRVGPSDEEMRTSDPALFDLIARYFPGTAEVAATKRLSRLTRLQLDSTAKALFPNHVGGSAMSALPKDPLQTHYEYAANLSFNAANFTPLRQWVDSILTLVKANPAGVIPCAAAETPCQRTEAQKLVAKAFRGTQTNAKVAEYADVYVASVGQVGFAEATADLVDLILTSPHFLFRNEVSTGAGGALLPANQLENLTYTLADAPPEAVALSSADPLAAVGSEEARQRTVEQLLGTPQARQKLLRFFAAWLEVKEPDAFTLAAEVYPEFTPQVAAAAVAEANAFLEHQLSKAAPTLKDVTQSSKSFVSSALASIYGMQPSGLSGSSLVDLNPAQRFGVFTLPAVIASHSGPTSTRLVKRGVFFTRKVMCMPLGAPPSGVDTALPPEGSQTERQKIESVTATGSCAGCHMFINPFGFMQENYEATGQWRTQDHGQPIDASIAVSFLDEGALQANDPVTALKGFTQSMRFKQCFVRQLFRFYSGRDETPGDDPVLRQMLFQFAHEDSQDIVGLLRTLGTSNRLSHRTDAP